MSLHPAQDLDYEEALYRRMDAMLSELMERNPTGATQMGDHRWDDRLADRSAEALDEEYQGLQAMLADFTGGAEQPFARALAIEKTMNAGFPAVRVMESIEDPDLLNSNRDTWDLIDYNYLQRMVQLNVAVAANLAGGPQQPAPPIIVSMAEPGAYLLTWPVSPNASGYAISFRPVDSLYCSTVGVVKAANAVNVTLTGLDPNVT